MNGLTGYNARLTANFIRLSVILSVMIGIIGCLALIGWIYEIEFLKSVLPHALPMKANAAIGFILISFSLLLQINSPLLINWRTIIAKVLALTVFMIGLLTLIEAIYNINLHIDQLVLLQLSDDDFYYNNGRMAPITAVVFILSGLALFLCDLKNTIAICQVLAYLIFSCGFFVITAITYHFDVSYNIMPYAHSSIQSAFNFILIALSLLFMRPNTGVMNIIASDTTGGALARRLLPIIFIIPAAVGYIKILGEHYQLYDLESGIAIYSILTLSLLMPFVILAFKRLVVTDLISKNIEIQLKQDLDIINDLYNFAPCGYHSIDKYGTIIRINQTELDWLGYTSDQVIGNMGMINILTPASFIKFSLAFKELKLTGKVKNIEYDLIRKNGSTFTVISNSTAIRDDDGNFLMSRTTIIDISELKIAKDKLNLALVKSEQSNKDLQEFANMASHDLQEPIRTISSFIQLIQKNNKDKLDKDSIEFMNFIIDATSRMQVIIDDLLCLARVTTRAKPFAMVDSNDTLHAVLNLLNTQITQHKAKITSDKLPRIFCDDSQLYQVFQNLITNAIKFCDTSPLIHISSSENMNFWQFSIKDNGIGIATEHIDQIFNPFRRLNPMNKYPGTGIGLTICKKIIERHAGKIWAESQPGKGSTFYFTIPKPTSPADSRHDISGKQPS